MQFQPQQGPLSIKQWKKLFKHFCRAAKPKQNTSFQTIANQAAQFNFGKWIKFCNQFSLLSRNKKVLLKPMFLHASQGKNWLQFPAFLTLLQKVARVECQSSSLDLLAEKLQISTDQELLLVFKRLKVKAGHIIERIQSHSSVLSQKGEIWKSRRAIHRQQKRAADSRMSGLINYTDQAQEDYFLARQFRLRSLPPIKKSDLRQC